MRIASKFINEKKDQFQQSLLRNPAGKVLLTEERSKTLAQIDFEWTKLLEKCRQPLHIVMMGQVKAGKSTLLNAIVGREVSPVNVTEATACIIEVSFAEQENAEILKVDGGSLQGSPAKIMGILTEKQNDPLFFDQCSVVRIQMPLPRLKDFLVVDTPGLATMTEKNALRAQDYFQTADVVLWILNGNYLGNSDVNEELRKVAKMGKPILAIVNRIDEYENDIEECIEYVKQELGIYVQTVLPLSARNAYRAEVEQDAELMKKSGFTELLDYLENKIERNREVVHNDSLISSAKALLGRELLLHKECLAEIEGKLLIVKAHEERLAAKGQMIREVHRNRVHAWFSQEFLAEKERQFSRKIEEMNLIDSFMGSQSQDLGKNFADLFSEQSVRQEIQTFLADLDRSMQEDWRENLRAVQQEVATDFAKFQQKYQDEMQLIVQSLPSAGKSALSGLGEGVMVAGVAGTALASYTALIGPMSAYISMGSALSSTLPPLMLAGAAAGAVIGVLNFSKEKKHYRREVAEVVGKIRESAITTVMPAVYKAIDEAAQNVAQSIQEQVVGAEFAGMKLDELAKIQNNLQTQICVLEKAREIERI